MLKFVIVLAGSAFAAALCMFSTFLRTGEDPADDGPRAAVSQFVGLWFGIALVFWSFFLVTPWLRWGLRTAAAVSALAGLALASFLAQKTEVDETPAHKETGFKSDMTDLHLS